MGKNKNKTSLRNNKSLLIKKHKKQHELRFIVPILQDNPFFTSLGFFVHTFRN